MKKIAKFSAIVISAILVLGMFSFASCDFAEVKKPEPEPIVQSVTIKYEDAVVNETMSVDVSKGSIRLSASVIKDADADGTVTYESSDPSVAAVANDGTVTLLKAGETIITAKAGDQYACFALVVRDDFSANSYEITVVGGTADKTRADKGEVVILTPAIPEHQEFVKWEYSVEGIVLNGNAFEMPNQKITVTAVYKEKLYTLNVVGATFNTTEYEGKDGGNIKNGELEKYDMTTYQLPYDTPVTLKAITPSAGETFVAWDYGQQGNRVGELGVDTYTFNMPGENSTVWANYARLNSSIFTQNEVIGFTATKIELDGLTGFNIQASGASSTSYTENIQGSSFTTADGAKMVKSVFQNNGTKEVSVEIYPSYYGNTSPSGEITVPAGETVTHYFAINTIVNNPSWGIRFTKATSSAVDLSFGVGCAELYPEGDPFALNKADFVEVQGYMASSNGRPDGGSGPYQIWYGSNFAHTNSPRFSNNANGTTVMATRNEYVKNYPGFFIYSQITNMGEFDADNATKTIYVQITNSSYTNPVAKYELLVTKNVNFKDSNDTTRNATVLNNILDSQEISFTQAGEQIVIKLEVPRTASDTSYAFVIRKPTIESASTSKYSYNINLKMAYNDVFGYEAA